MKKIKYLVILLLPFLLTGCVKINASMKIKMDKSMDYEIIEAFDTSLMGDLSDGESTTETSMINEDDLDKYKKLGYTIEEYNEDNMKGYRIARHFKNIDTISTTDDIKTNLSMDSDNQYLFKIKKGFFKNTYTVILSNDDLNEYSNSFQNDSDSENELEFDSEEEKAQYEELMKQMDLKFTVELPFKAKSSNATTTEKGGKKLTWNLAKQKDDINFTFALYNIENILAVFGIIIVGIIGIVIGYIKTKNNNKKDKSNNNNMNSNNIDNNSFNNNQNINQTTQSSNENNNFNNQGFQSNQVNNIPNNNGFQNNNSFTTNQINQNFQNDQINNNDIFNQNFPK